MQAFLTSPRNSPAAHEALFKRLNCGMLLTSNPTPPPAEKILKAYPLKHLQISSVAELLEQDYPQYPYEKTFATAASQPFAILCVLLLPNLPIAANSSVLVILQAQPVFQSL
jgi:hypothetical protein